MERRLFHGSEHVLKEPVFGKGKPYNDYGLGFYCTEHSNLAMEWAVGFDHSGYANEYTVDFTGLAVLDLSSSCYTTLHWLAVLLKNRWFDIRAPLANEARDYLLKGFLPDITSADVVEGYRADDSYFSFAQDFISGAISYQQLSRAMKLGDLGKQVMLKSKKAFNRISFVQASPAPKEIWLPRREQRDRDARNAYFNQRQNVRNPGDLFITQIIDEGIGADDARL